MKTYAFFAIILSITLTLIIHGCAVADTTENNKPNGTESEDSDEDTPSDPSTDLPTDTEQPDSSDSESTPDSQSGDDTETEDTETLPPEDTDWIDDPNIIYYSTFNGSDGDFTASSIDGVGNPWEWGIPDTSGYPSNPDGRAWGTNLTAVHGACETAALTSKDFDLSQYAGKTVSISWVHSIYYSVDVNPVDPTDKSYQAGLTVEIFNGSSWLAPEDAPTCEADGCDCDTGWTASAFQMTCNNTPTYLDGKPGFGGNSCAWEKRQATITWQSYPADFKFRFIHGAASTSAKPGAYIDNVELSVF